METRVPPGVAAAGDSRKEVESLLRDAVEFHIEGLKAEGFAVPQQPGKRSAPPSLLASHEDARAPFPG